MTKTLSNVNSEELRSLKIPLPPLPVQQAMMKRVETGRAAIQALRADAQARADVTKADLEAMILGTESG